MRVVNWHPEERIPGLAKVGMDRLEKAAGVVQLNAILKLRSLIKETYPEHGPYRRFRVKASEKLKRTAHWEDYGNGSPWTARHYRAMVATIRVVRKKDPNVRNVWIMAGNYVTWWALQMEYGGAGWKGGRKSFLRPALKGSESQIRAILESGQGETEGY